MVRARLRERLLLKSDRPSDGPTGATGAGVLCGRVILPMDGRVFAQLLLGVERLATAGPRARVGRVGTGVEQAVAAEVDGPFERGATAGPIAPEVLVVLV